MRNMANIYRKLTSGDLKTLRSKKVNRLQKLSGEPRGFFVSKEIEALTHQIHQIDVELTARFYKMGLPE